MTVHTPSEHYWYESDDDAVVAVLRALRRFRRADQDLRRRMSADMDMNVTDVQALQFVIAAERHGELPTPRQLSRHLAISTASTTKLLDRLTASGHLERLPHPRDRRSLVLRATAHAHEEIRARLGRMHARMAEIARAVPPEARAAVVHFLTAMAEELDAEGGPLAPDGTAGAPTHQASSPRTMLSPE
ncbi:MarR family winged helix-turn-helix transcriptional regulator [Georgenia sp. AZ-5]|uniref:MarR family winged helix-turn-helix transcriptional regulator n=1 Tax=Georgenia sp. AZ-5 TaxID=3367526 RepID=UPI003754E5A0